MTNSQRLLSAWLSNVIRLLAALGGCPGSLPTHLGGDGHKFQPRAQAEQRIRPSLVRQLAGEHLNRHSVTAAGEEARQQGSREAAVVGCERTGLACMHT
jgi:hypothetical protein